MRRVEWHPLAREDLLEAARFYKEERPGRDERFLAAVERTIELLRQFPFIGQTVDDERRGIPARHFPYTVIYRVSEQSVEVVAIAHQKRGDGLWLGR